MADGFLFVPVACLFAAGLLLMSFFNLSTVGAGSGAWMRVGGVDSDRRQRERGSQDSVRLKGGRNGHVQRILGGILLVWTTVVSCLTDWAGG